MVSSYLLPGGLLNAGKLTCEGVLPEAETAEFKLAHKATGTSADLAAIAVLGRELGLGRVFVSLSDASHDFSSLLAEGQAEVGQQSPSFGISGR